MSAPVMSAVWSLDLPAAEKFVLLALADHADHHGGSVRPSVDRVAWKTGYSVRQVQRIIRTLEHHGILVVTRNIHGGRGMAREYRIDLAQAAPLAPFEGGGGLTPYRRAAFLAGWFAEVGTICGVCALAGDEQSGPDGDPWHVDRIVPGAKGGRYEDGNVAILCATCNKKKGAILAPLESRKGAIYNTERVPSASKKGAIHDQKGAIAMSPQPSEPSLSSRLPSESLLEQKINGAMTTVVAKYAALDPLLSEGWLRGVLRRVSGSVGEMERGEVLRHIGMAEQQIKLRYAAVKVGKADPIHSPRKFAERVITTEFGGDT